MIFQFFMVFVIPVVISLLITPWVIRFATRMGAMDQPSPRKIHTRPIPRLGGVAIYASFFLSLGLLNLIDPSVHQLTSLAPTKGMMLTLGLVLIVGIGIFDDLHPRTPTQKLILQLIAGTEVLLSGDGMRPETLNRLRQLARAHGFALRRFEIHMEKVPLENQKPPALRPPKVLVSEGERELESIRM